MTPREPIGRLRYLFFRCDVEPLRFFIALSSLLWGILLFWPGETFDRQTYALMGTMAPEWGWALAHLLHGIAAVWSIVTGRKNRAIWVLDPILGCLLWTTSAAAMLFAVFPVPAAIAPHIIGAAVSWWLLVRYKGLPK